MKPKKIKSPREKTLYKARRQKKIAWVMLILIGFSLLLCVNFVSATEGDYTGEHFSTEEHNGMYGGMTTDGTHIWLTNAEFDVVVKYTVDGTYINNFSVTTEAEGSQGVTTNGSNIWVLDQATQEVYKYTMDGTYTTEHFDILELGAHNTGLANNETNLWIHNRDDKEIYKYNRDGTYTEKHWDISGQVTTVYDITTYKNYAWVLDVGNKEVYKYYTNGTYISSFDTSGQVLTGSTGIATDGYYIWVHDHHQKEVYKYEGLSSPPTTTEFDINLTSPANETSISIIGTNFTVDYNITTTLDYNWTNTTYYIWNSTGLFNNSVIVKITGTYNSTDEYIDEFILGEYEWNVLACYRNATYHNCTWADANYSLNVGASLNSTSYNNLTYETSSETFNASFKILEGSEISLVQLVYNGTNYTISDIITTATTLNISRTIDIPLNVYFLTNETRDFFFRFTYAGAYVQETETYYQNISFINLQLCNTTYSMTTLNFTYYDEITNTEIDASNNATSIQTTFNYWIGSGDIYRNYSYTNLTNSVDSQYKFCIYPIWQTLKTNMDLDYEAKAYSPRTYHLRNASLTNQTNEISLNLLTIEDSVKFFIDVKQGMMPFTNAIITISKYFTGEGVYKTIGIRETDEVGEFIEYLDLDKKYKFSVVKEGVSYGTIIKQASCEEAPCELSLQVEEAEVDVWQGYYDIFATNVAYTLFYNDTNKIVTYTFNDLTGLAQYFRLLVTQISYNKTGATICDVNLYSTSGTLTCDMTGYGGDFRATGYIHRSPGKTIAYILFVISTIKDVLGATGILVSLFIIITVALVGAWNPAVGVILVAFSVFMMKILGFVAFGYTTVILIFIMAAILAIKMKT